MARTIPIIVNQTIPCAFVSLICLFSQSAALAQDTAPSSPSSDYVSRAEYDKLKAEHEAMKQELSLPDLQVKYVPVNIQNRMALVANGKRGEALAEFRAAVPILLKSSRQADDDDNNAGARDRRFRTLRQREDRPPCETLGITSIRSSPT